MKKRRDGPMAALYREAIDVCACPWHTGKPSAVLETHHIVPISRGGVERDFNNFVCLCHRCHRGNNLHSDFDNMLPDVLFWKAFSELLILGTTSNDCDERTFRQVLLKSAKDMREPGGYETRIKRLYEMVDRASEPAPVLSIYEMLEIDNGRTDARIDEMHGRVKKQLNRERRNEKTRIKNIPIYGMWTKG